MENPKESPTKNNRRQIIVVSLIGIATLALLAWHFSDLFLAREWAAYRETDDWLGWESRLPPDVDQYEIRTNDPLISPDVRPSILLKSNVDQSRLVLRHRYSTRTYMFDSESNVISPSNDEEWDAASDKVTNCWSQIGHPYNEMFEASSYPDYKWSIDGQPLPSHGRYTFRATRSPTGKKAAVLSGSGWLRGPGFTIIFGLGGPEPRISFGQLYLEVLDLETKTRLSGPFRLKSESPLDPNGQKSCWSDDEKFVVVYSGERWISVVKASD